MNFLGQYDCTMDDKGRVKMPSGLRKQFPAGGSVFVIAKDLEDCLVIYPKAVWEEQERRLKNLNPFNPQHRRFINLITTGLTEVEFDSADRFLINSSLKKYLGNGKDILLKGMFNKIQIWDAKKYDKYNEENISNAAQLADEVANYLDGKGMNGLNE